MEKLRIGFVGVGSMGQAAHLRNYACLPECEVVAIAEVRPRLAKRVAERYGVPKTYPSAEAMLAAEKLDGIVASQPFDRHGSLLPTLYQAGTPLFTEKPLASSIETGERLLAACKDGGAWHMVGYHKRCDPATVRAKQEIDLAKAGGNLGAMRYVRVTMPPGDWIAGGFNELVTTDEAPPAIEADPPAKDMDGGTFAAYISFVNYYIHQVNLMRFLLGEPYRVNYADPSGVLLAVQSGSGVAGTIEMAPYHTKLGWHEAALIGFDHGYIRLSLPAPLASNQSGRVEIFSDKDGTLSVPDLPPIHAMRAQAQAFLQAIAGERKPPCEAAEALEDLRIARDYIRLKDNS